MKKYILILILIVSLNLFADTDPPYVEPLYPTAEATGIPVDSDVTFHIFDDNDGVDISSVIVNVNGVNYSNTSGFFYYSGTVNDYIVTINPPVNFQFGQTVTIQITAEDLENPPNIMPNFSYSFQCIDDLQPPYVGNLDPDPDSINNPVDTDVTFYLYDSGLGVNISSVIVNIEGVDYTHNDDNFTYSGTPNNYSVIIDIPINFEFGQIVSVMIDASDLNGMIMSTFQYSFHILDDLQPPFTGEWQPAPNSINNPIDTNVAFNIYDNIQGVDIASVIVDIQGSQFTHLNTSFTFQTITNGYSIVIDLINDFDYGEIVNVQIEATDLSQPANVMATYSYNFQCEYDIMPPYLGGYDPIPGEQNVPIDTDIAFNVYDNDIGIDISTLSVNVNGEVYTTQSGNLNYSGDVNNYNIVISPTENFEFDELVEVVINVSDLNQVPNSLIDFSYSFQCIADELPPVIEQLDPAPETTNVALNENITFHILDSGYGVDINSLNVNVDGLEYLVASSNLSYSGTSADYFISINPTENFTSADTIDVSVTAADLAVPPNIMPTLNYSFYCVNTDNEAPFLWGEFPQNNSINVPVDSEISFFILDDINGVNPNSIELLVNDIGIEDYELEPFTLSNGSGYRVTYQPEIDFDYNELVEVEVSATDLAVVPNLLTNASFSFVCEEYQPPTIDLPDSLVCDEDGSIIENFGSYITNPENDDLILEATITNNLTITIDGYLVIIEPDINWFGSENISFFVKDEMGESLASDNTNIIVSSVNDAPSFDMSIFPKEISFVENTQEIIDFSNMLIDPEQQSDDLSLTITGNSNIYVEIEEFVVTFKTLLENWIGSEILTVTIDDNINRATSTEELLVRVTPEIPDEKVEIDPHTVTWNDDYCEITIYSQVDIEKISGKIFNRSGRLINKLEIQPYGENKLAFWDKKDTKQNLVSGGFYIYQIKISNRIYQGSIIIAR